MADWDALEALDDNGTALICGRRGSGKSILIKEICHSKKHIPLCMVISPTACNGFYDTWVPRSCIYEHFHERLIVSLIDRQKRLLEENKSLPKSDRVDVRCILVLDDCISEAEMRSSAAVRTLYTNGRHLGVCVITATQHITSLSTPPVVRSNSDVVFVFAQSSSQAIDMVVDQWLSGCTHSTPKEAVAIMQQYTKERPYQCFVIDAKKAALGRHVFEFCTRHVAETEFERFRMGDGFYWNGFDYTKAPPKKTLWGRIVDFFSEEEPSSSMKESLLERRK